MVETPSLDQAHDRIGAISAPRPSCAQPAWLEPSLIGAIFEMPILPNWLQELGAMAGLAVAAFTIFDRFARGRPRLSVFVAEDQRSIRVSNDAAHDIAVLNWSVYPPAYAVAEIASHQAAVRATAGRSFQLMMKPKSER